MWEEQDEEQEEEEQEEEQEEEEGGGGGEVGGAGARASLAIFSELPVSLELAIILGPGLPGYIS